MPKSIDDLFYLPVKEFFESNAPYGLTFDDVSLATRYSEILPRDTNLEVQLSSSLHLNVPILSADMDTVTEAEMAIAMAQNGGMGIIHYNMSTREQVKEVARVKNNIHGLIQDPITVKPDMAIADVSELIAEKGFGFSTFPVIDDKGKLLGLLPGRVVKGRYHNILVKDAMTPRKDTYTVANKELGKDPIAVADKFFTNHLGIHKLLVVDDQDHLCGLFTLSDIEKINEEKQNALKPARDSEFRLVCGAAIHASRDKTGELDSKAIIDHVGALVDEGVDAVAVSTAHGHTLGVGQMVLLVRDAFPDLTIIAGNVTSAAGVHFLAEAGAHCIKIGQGPGSICTTRVVAGVGIPQLTALYAASQTAQKAGVKIIADGGLTKSGDIVKALTMADAVMCGGLLAGCKESPGRIIEINGKLYKQYRGMGSMEAMRKGSAARYGHKKNDKSSKIAAEGVEALKEVSSSLDSVLGEIIGGLQSGMGYLGARNLSELGKNARFVRITSAGMRESAPHDIVEVKTTKESV